MLSVDDVARVRARAVVDIGMRAASFDEPELAAALLGCGHRHLLSVQDLAGRLPLLAEPHWRCEVCCIYHVTFRLQNYGKLYVAHTSATPLGSRRTLIPNLFLTYSHVCDREVSLRSA